jgi:REP element-mobilizing transposase RayT
MTVPVQPELPFPPVPVRGGARPGAGRRPTGQFGRDSRGRPRSGVAHRVRAAVSRHKPLHVTVRTIPHAPSLRNRAVAAAVGAVLKRRAQRDLRCRVVQFSLQRDHMHLLVEAEDREALTRGMQGLLSGLARVVNTTSGGRGSLWRDRYHARQLGTPKEVRACLVYVLRNSAKHAGTSHAIDLFSSAAWFSGFAEHGPLRADAPPCVPARRWLLDRGWRERAGGPIRLDELPARAPP